MKILFILGFANPFPGTGWTRIGFFAKNIFRKISITSLIFQSKNLVDSKIIKPILGACMQVNVVI